MSNPNDGLYTSADNVASNGAAGGSASHGGCGCGCGHNGAGADKPVNPQQAEVREEIKIVPADHAAQSEAHAAHSEGHAEGTCACGCGHDHGRGQQSEEEYTDPDAKLADGTDPAVQTINPAEGHDQHAEWNNGVRPADGGESEASGAGSSDAGHLN